MSERFFTGRFSRLTPPLVFGGKAWGGVILWDNNPGSITRPGGADRGDTTIREGTIHLIQDIGGGYKRVWFKRGLQSFSYTKVMAAGDATEVEYQALMGGNIVQTIEPIRGYSWNNERSFRGCDSLDRVEPGHVMWWNGRGFEVTAIHPMGLPPATVSWAAETPTPTTTRLEVLVNDLVLVYPPERGADNPSAVPHFVTTDTGIFGDCGVYIDGELVTRRLFTTPGGVQDPEWYPPGAEFTADEAEYWFDPITLRFRMGSGTEALREAPEDVIDALVVSYHRGLRKLVGESLGVYTLESSGAGYGLGDAMGVMQALTDGDFSYQFFILKGGDNNFGQGSLEWRIGKNAQAPFVAIQWTNDFITAVKRRTEIVGAIEEVEFTANETGFGPAYFLVTIAKVGDEVTVSWQNEGGAPTVAAVVTMPDVEELTKGFVGVATWGNSAVKFIGWGGEDCELLELTVDDAVIGRQEIQTFGDVRFSRDYTMPAAEAITSVTGYGRQGLASADEFAMTENATLRRNTFDLPGGNVVRVRSEASGDRVRVIQAAPVSVPEGTGRPPRLGGTRNLATFNETGDGSTENVYENVANWHDGVTVFDPHGELEAIAGESATFKNNLFASELDPPKVSCDVKDRASTFELVPAGDLLSRWVEARTLVSEAYLGELPAGGLVCFRGHDAAIYYQDGAMQARMHNELARCIDSFDQHSIGVIMGGGEVSSVKGLTGWMDAGATNKGCVVSGGSEDFVNTGVAYGMPRTTLLHPYRFDPPAIKPGWPFWHSGLYFDASVRAEATEEVLTCGTHSYSVRDLTVAGGFWYVISPIGSISDIDEPGYANYCGGILGRPGTEGLGGNSAMAQFYFGGISFMPGPILKRIVDGAVCVEAKVEVLFTGLRSRTVQTVERQSGGIDLEQLRRRTCNGELQYELSIAADGTVLNDFVTPAADDLDEGELSLVLMARRRRSASVQNWDETLSPLPQHQYAFLGAATAVTAAAGRRKVIDIAPLINALIGDRGSNLTDYMLWPTVSGVVPGTSADSLGEYLCSLMPATTATILETVGHKTRMEWTGSSRLIGFDSWGAESVIYCRFRYPSGILTDMMPIPFVWPKAMV